MCHRTLTSKQGGSILSSPPGVRVGQRECLGGQSGQSLAMMRLAESKVLDSSMAMVMGPTPPGTGVILDATLTTSSKSTSPVRRYPDFFVASGTELVPTSMTAAPFLTQLLLIMCAEPAAAMMMSAFLQIPSGSAVRLCTTVTVQSFFMSMSAAGMPTMLLRPTTTAFFPASATPLRSSSTTHPLGVHGMNSGSWPFMLSLPMFSGWKPSTSFSRLMAASTFSSFICLGSGSCTRMPWQSALALNSDTIFSTSASVAVSGSSLWKDTMPASSHALRFIRT
mmetsp:Transcript_26341/g.42225  ORF Transcript_26341/g.42225 Transcript_26341/m.42225 type:complete len:280 (-) Transcript_26341:354-1193(-)